MCLPLICIQFSKLVGKFKLLVQTNNSVTLVAKLKLLVQSNNSVSCSHINSNINLNTDPILNNIPGDVLSHLATGLNSPLSYFLYHGERGAAFTPTFMQNRGADSIFFNGSAPQDSLCLFMQKNFPTPQEYLNEVRCIGELKYYNLCTPTPEVPFDFN